MVRKVRYQGKRGKIVKLGDYLKLTDKQKKGFKEIFFVEDDD